MKRVILILLFTASTTFASYQIQLRRDTAANWTAVNPTLAQGEVGYETDTLKAKIGDGSTAWAGLSYTTFFGITADSPLSGAGTPASHLVIANAAADGSTKGVAAFTAIDFTASLGVISLNRSATLAGNPVLGANGTEFASTGLIFEGATNDNNETLLTITDPTTADKTITFPNASGTVAVSATTPITLSAAGDIGLTLAKDIVAGVGLSGGEDNVLPGAEADTTLTFDATELSALTWSDNSQASIAWTWNLSGTDDTITFGSDLITLSNSLTVSTGKNIKLGTTTWNSGDGIDGEVIANDTIDDDSIDFTDVTGADLTLTDCGAITSSGIITGTKFISNAGDGNQPYACTSTTVNTNLNADTVDGQHASAFLESADIDTFAELDAIVADKTLVNTADGATWLGAHDFGGSTDFEIENSANPTVDTAGEIAVDSSATSGSMVRFYGDASYQLPGYYSKSFIITSPTATADSPIWRCPWAITIRAVHLLCIGGTNVVGQLDEYDGNGANPAVVDSSDITSAAGTNANDDGTLSNPSIDAGDYIGWHTTSVDGTITRAIVTFEYSVDAVN